ncbi:MAG: SdrD B-like domain-containing protein [Chloroflexota bacterium]
MERDPVYQVTRGASVQVAPYTRIAFSAVFTFLSITILLGSLFASQEESLAQSTGQTYTVQSIPYNYGGLVNFGDSSISFGFCYDYDKSAPGVGWDYTVITPSSTGISSAMQNQVAAALQGLLDGYNAQDVQRAIWNITNNKGFSGNAATIVNLVNNGTYQPQNVVWFRASSNSLQPMVALITQPTPTPTNIPTQTPSPTPVLPTMTPASPTPTPLPGVSIGGTLWYDTEDDGIHIPSSDVTFQNIHVELYTNSQNPAQDAPLMTTQSDFEGNYLFSNLTPGSYIVYIPTPPTNATLSSQFTDTLDNDQDNDDNGLQESDGGPVSSPIIHLQLGTEPGIDIDGDGPDSNLTIDFGFTGPGTVGGKVWDDVDRDGIQDSGEPGQGAVTVQLYDQNGAQIATTTTNSTGLYTLANVPVGRYRVGFETPGEGWWFTAQDQGSDDAVDSDADPFSGRTDEVSLLAGESLMLDAGFLQMQIGDYVWHDVDTNGIQGQNEPGLSGVMVELVSPGQWAFCSNEYETCTISGTATVRYGKNGIYNYQTATDSISCNNQTFGDPLYGTAKTCEYYALDSGSGQVVATTSTNQSGYYYFDGRDVTGGLEPNSPYELRIALNQAALQGFTPTRMNVDSGPNSSDELDSDATREEEYAVINLTTGTSNLNNFTHDFGFGLFTAKISGEAWNDLEGNGIQNPIIPLADGVPVTLMNTRGDIIASTETTDAGTYQFDNLPSDDYVLEFLPPVPSVWFTIKDQGTDEALDSDITPENGLTDVLSMQAGEQNNLVDVGIIRGELAYAPRLPNPGDQTNKVGDTVELILIAIDDENDQITYEATNLPPGLTIGEFSGAITGVPTSIGTFDVTITVKDGTGGISRVSFLWLITEIPIVNCYDMVQEAETAILYGHFARIISLNEGASGGQYIMVPDGFGTEWNGAVEEEKALFCIRTEEAGTYRMKATVLGESSDDNSFYVVVDGTPVNGYLWDVEESQTFIDDYVSHRGGADPVEVALAAGNHIFAIHLREDGAKLDKLALELVHESPQSNGCGGMSQEAESGTLHGNFQIYDDAVASGGQGVYVPDFIGSNFSGATVQDKAEYCFDVPAAGSYLLQGTVQAPDSYDDSFYVTVDGVPSNGYLWDTARTTSSSYALSNLNNRGGANPVILNLSAGQHIISVYLREDGTKLDKLELVDAGVVSASTFHEPTETELPSNGIESHLSGVLSVPSTYQNEPTLAGLSVKVTGAGGYSEEVMTDIYGQYYIDDVPAGEYTVTVELPGEDGGTEAVQQPVSVGTLEVTEASVEYRPFIDNEGAIFLPLIQGR